MQQAKQTPSRQQPRSAAAGRVTRAAPAAGFTDNRPAAIAQRKLAEAIEHSPQALAQRALISAMHDGSYGTAQRKRLGSMFGKTAQLAGGQEEELLQGKFSPVQRQGPEEELLQGKFAPVQREGGPEEELLQGKFEVAQRQGPEEEELLQGKFAPVQRAEAESNQAPRENNTGLPDNLKAGIESLSGISLDHVKVHYNSAQPAQLNALAYAQGNDIHVAPGQEQHLPHEAWHVVQQAQGRVRPTRQMKEGVPVNDDARLEREADLMGGKAAHTSRHDGLHGAIPNQVPRSLQVAINSDAKQLSKLQATAYSQGALQLQCPACQTEEGSIQRVASTTLGPIQLRGTIEQCEGYHMDYKAKQPKKCTQNHTKAEMEANVIATQAHIAGRELYIAEECDDVLPGSIAKGPGVALASHQQELASVKNSLANCQEKIATGKFKK